jgi:hypothetical protein
MARLLECDDRKQQHFLEYVVLDRGYPDAIMPSIPLELYTRPRNQSHLRDVISRINSNLANNNTDLTVIEGVLWQTVTNNETVAITKGAPVYSDGSGTVQLGLANAISTSEVVGLVYADSIAAAATGRIQSDGYFTATTAQWDVITGGTAGLVAGMEYYLDPATAGMLTTTAPVSGNQEVVAPIGKAISDTVMKLEINHTVLLA